MVHIDYNKVPKEQFNISAYHDDDIYFKTKMKDEADIAISNLRGVLTQIENNIKEYDNYKVRRLYSDIEGIESRFESLFEDLGI